MNEKLNIGQKEVRIVPLDEYYTAYRLQELINQLKIMTPKSDKIGLKLIKELEKYREIQKKEGKTMNKEELQELISDLQNQLQDAQNKLEKLGKYERFKPEEGETYYYIDNCNCVSTTTYDVSFDGDCHRYKTYNCFKTKEEAEKEANKILIRRKLEDIARRLNGDEKIDWNDETQPKYYIVFNDKDNGGYMQKHLFDNATDTRRIQGTVYCLRPNFLVRAIEEIGKQELIDYIKGE